MYCNKCGSPIADNARFCPVCGNPVGAAGQQAVPSAPRQAGLPPQQPAPSSQQAAPSPQQPLSSAPAAPMRPRSKKPLTAALIVLVIALGVGGGALFYFTQLAPTKIDEKTFPDAGLRALVSTKFDTNRDGKLSRDEVKLATKLDLSDVSSTQGLGKALPDLAVIEGGDKKLDYLDLSGCSKLQKVSLDSASNVHSVNLDGCDDITELSLGNADDLKQVDLTGKKKLATLSLSQNTDVKGIGDTQLDELWLPVSYESTDKSDVYGAMMDIDRDENGYVTSYTQGVKQGGGYKVEVEHDKNGLISKMTDTMGSAYSNERDITRDKDGKITRVDAQDYTDGESNSSSTQTYEYDKDGNLIAIERPSKYGDQDSSFAYKNGKLINDTELSAANPQKVVYSYEYDKKGNVTSYVLDSRGDTAGTSWTLTLGYEYDKDGNIKRISPTAYDTHGNDYGTLSGSFAAVDYTYDKQGRVSKITSERGGAYADFSYDSHGNLYEIDEYNGDGDIQYTYELDYQRYFCNKSIKNKPEEWLRLGPTYDVDHGSWDSDSDYGDSNFTTAYMFSPLNEVPEPFVGTRATLR